MGNKKRYEQLMQQARERRFEQDVAKVDDEYLRRFSESAGSYLDSAKKQYDGLGYGNAYQSYLNRRDSYTDLDYRRRVIQEWSKRNPGSLDQQSTTFLDSFGRDSKGILDAFSGMQKYFSQFDSEEGYKQYLEDQERWSKLTDGYDPTANAQEGRSGWRKYQEAMANAPKQADETKDPRYWWRQLGSYGIGTPDTALAQMNTQQVAQLYREMDAAMGGPDSRWSREQQETFGFLYGRDPKKAESYARAINEMLNAQQEQQQRDAIKSKATSGFGAGFAHTAGAILAGATGLADFQGDLIRKGATGSIPTADGYVTPFEYSQEVTGGISRHLNEKYGTIDENVWMLGGKGLGDLYGLGVSAAQSMIYGKTMGELPTLITFFGSGAASAVDEAKARGASDEQALIFGAISGAAEFITEKIPLENLLNMGRAQDLKGLFWDVLKQGGEEAMGEGLNSIITSIADYFTFGELSTYNMAKQEYMAKGMTGEEAAKRAFRDIAEDIAFDALGGFVTGTSSAGIMAGVPTAIHNANVKKNYGQFQQELVAEGLESADGTESHELAAKYQLRLDRGKKLTGGQLSRLIDANEQAFRAEEKAAQEAQGSSVTEETESGESGQAEAELPFTMEEEAPKAAATVLENRTVSKKEAVDNNLKATDEESTDVAEEPAQTVSLEEAAKGYGDQAQAMIHTYEAGQDVKKYDAAYRAAYDMGRSGVSLSYTMKSASTAYLNENQRKLAHAAGVDASGAAAKARAGQIQPNGKTGRKQGAVKGEGVTIADLKKTFNDTQGRAYKVLSAVAEVTGIDIVLYRSQADEGGKFQGAQGKYDRKNDPGTLYIDLNAGLSHVKDVNDLGKFAMLRTFSHEFTHFIENWNPEQYNELRKAVFQTMEENGEEPSDLIELKMEQNSGMDYEAASREVVAEAMTDILEDSSFIQTLAEKHKTVFQKLAEKLKEFVEELRSYFASIGSNPSREAKAIKQQVGENLKYFDGIVELFDRAAVQAVENYQSTAAEDVVVAENATTATDNATGPSDNATETVDNATEDAKFASVDATLATENATLADESEATTEVATSEAEEVVDPLGFTIRNNAEHGSLEISFEGKPSDEVRHALKENKFRWHKVKKVWFGYTDRQTITDALHKAYAADEAQTESKAAEPAEPVVQAAEKGQYDEIGDALDTAEEPVADAAEIPAKAETEEAKQELRNAVRMPIQGTNMEALLEGIKNRELSMASITMPGSVEGFNAEQRHHLVTELLKGVYTGSEAIKIEVPYDGKFEIVNTPGNVAKVLDNLKVRVRQEALFDKKTVSILTSNGDMRIVDLHGRKYLSNSYVLLPATEAAAEYAKVEFKGKESPLHPEVQKIFAQTKNPLTEAPTEGKLDKKTVLIFNVDGKKLIFDKGYFAPLDGGQLYYADFAGAAVLKSVDSNGQVLGYLMGIRPKRASEITGEKPSNLKSFAKKKSAKKQAEAPAPKAEAAGDVQKKPSTPKAEEKKAKPAIVESSVKLEDFGEKIGGARKDQWSKRGLLAEDLSEMNDREREKNVKKDNVWKRPDYRKLIEGGSDRNLLFVRNEIRKALNQNITYPYRVSDPGKKKLQEDFVETVRAIQTMAEKVTTKEQLAAMGRPWLVEQGYRTDTSFTEKWRKNPALHGTNYVQTIEHLTRNWDQLSKLADRANFAVDAEKKIPAGFSIHEDDKNHTWFVARGSWIVKHSFPSYDDALNYLRTATSNTKKKTRFVPEQLLEVHRKGPNYRGGKDVRGQDYLDTFGFKGGEFGNWMTEKDRRVSMNYGFDALKDLADALGIQDTDISLGGNLSIAFGARGQGLSGAAAHYEQERHVINLTKMNGAGSLAHEWFHSLDDFLGGYGNKFATEYGSQLPEGTKTAVRHLLTTMQYRDATQEETDMAATKAYEQAQRSVTYQVANQFGWVRRIEEGKFQESDARYYSRTPTEADVKKYHELLDKLLETGDMAVLEELSALRKEVAGHVIPKEDRESIGYRLSSLRPDATKNVQKMRLRSDFYNNSRRFGELHHKDGDYWDSTIEMAARAFACYVADKTGKHNDYLSAHSDTAVTLDVDKEGNVKVVRAFPVGEERVRINAAFDQLIAALKADGFLQERGETVKPDMIQYQRRPDVPRKFSYEWFKDKPNMVITEVERIGKVNTKELRNQIIDKAMENAKSVGTVNEQGNPVVRIKDTGADVMISKTGIRHSMDRRADVVGSVAVRIGDILSNAILANELNPRSDNIKDSYVLIGAAKNKTNEPYIVSFVVNRYTSEVTDIDVLYAVNAKKEPAGSNSPRLSANAGSFTGSTISISNLLDFVNQYFPDIMPEEVLKHYGHDRRPDGVLGADALYQQRNSTLTDREVLAIAANEIRVDTLSEAEKSALSIFQERLGKLEDLQTKRAEEGRLYKEQQFGQKVDREAAAATLNRMHTLDAQIQRASSEVLDVEQKTVLREVLKKARKVVEKQQLTKDQQTLKRWRDRRNNADEIRKYRTRLSKDVQELTSWAIRPDNKNVVKHIPDALKQTVLPFLSSIDFTSKQQLNGKAATKADQEFIKRLRALETIMEESSGMDDMYANYRDLPPNFLERLHRFTRNTSELIESAGGGEFVVNRMTAEELKELSGIVRILKKYIMDMNKFHVNAMFQHVHEAGDNSIEFLGKLKPAQHTGAVSEFLKWQQMRPAYAFERFGEGGKAIYDGLRRGQATLAFDTKLIEEFAGKTYTTEEVRAWDKQLKTIKLPSGGTVTMKVSQIMSLYELSKRKQALGHILGEGIRVATFTDKGNKISDVVRTVTDDDLMAIFKVLTPRQTAVADKLQKFMQKQGGEWGNHVTLARFGEKQFGEENYFPINSDGRHLNVDADESPENASLYALLNMGFTKRLQEDAKNRIVIYSIFDVFANHMASMAQYHAFALPVVDALKWLNYKQTEIGEDGTKTLIGSVREEMDRAFGVPDETRPSKGKQGYAQNFVINIIKAFNGTAAQGTPYDSFGMQTLHRYNRAQVAYNFRVVVQQPMAITRAAQLISYGSIMKGLKLRPDVIRKNVEEMRKYSGIAAWKSLGFYDVNISRGLTAIIKHDESWQDKITDTGMWAAEKADTWTWAAMWAACKEEVISKGRYTPKNAGFYEAVTQLFEDVIYKTQVVDSVLTKNEFMRDKGFFARAVGSFMSEPTTAASMLIDAYDKFEMDMQRGLSRQQAWKKNSGNIVRTAYVYGIGALCLAAVQAVADSFRDDDDYQNFFQKWLEAFKGNLVDELMPMNKLPILDQFYEIAKEIIAVGGFDIYGQLSNMPMVEIAEKLIKGVEIIHDHITGTDTNYELYGGVYKLLQAASGMTGLPMAAATREIVTVWNNTVGAMAPSLKVKTYDPGEKNEIKYAYQDGYLTFAEAREELLATGLSEKEVKQITDGWLAAELQSQDERIREAAMARVSGDFDRYKELFYEIKGEGNYEFDVIMSAINSEINKIEKGLPEEPTYKAPDRQYDDESVFGIADYYTSIINGDTQTAASIKNDLVAELMGEGYLKHEAMDSVESSFAAKVKTGYMSGTLDARQATELLKGYGGKTTEESKSEIEEWDFELAQGYSWGSRVRGYRLGHISKNDLISAVMAVEGASRDEAMDYIRFLDLEKANGNISITASDAAGYFEHAEPAGIKISVYLDYKKLASACTGQKDENGKTISGSKKAEVLAVIDSMPLTVEQKDALYFENGYAASTLHEAPWH